MRGILAFLAVMGCAAIAAACDNDSETEAHEREFRSQYLKDQEATPNPDDFTSNYGRATAIGSGALMLAGGFYFSVGGRRRKVER